MAQSEKPVPAPDVDSAPYWAAAAAGELKLPTCRSCQTILFPPRSVCPQCLGSEVDWTALSGRAAVHSFGIMHDSFIKGFEPPYIVASVELEEQVGLRLTTNIVNCSVGDVYIGMPVSVIFDRRADHIGVPLFEPRG